MTDPEKIDKLEEDLEELRSLVATLAALGTGLSALTTQERDRVLELARRYGY